MIPTYKIDMVQVPQDGAHAFKAVLSDGRTYGIGFPTTVPIEDAKIRAMTSFQRREMLIHKVDFDA